jgi:hypothetical protein
MASTYLSPRTSSIFPCKLKDVIGGILLGVGVSLIFVGMQKQIESLMKSTINNIIALRKHHH